MFFFLHICRGKTQYFKNTFTNLHRLLSCPCIQAYRMRLLQCTPHESSSAQRTYDTQAPALLCPPLLTIYPSEAYPVLPSVSLSHPPENPLWSTAHSTEAPPQSHNPIRMRGRLTSREAESTAVHKRKSRIRDSVRLACVT